MKGQTISAITVLKLKHAAALETVLRNEVDELKGDIGTPYPPHSRPGTPPHEMTGALRDGIDYSLEQTDTGFHGAITSSRPGGDPDVPLYLEFGYGPRHASQSSRRGAAAGPLRAFGAVTGASPATGEVPASVEGATARPYMRPSMDRLAANLLRNLAEALEQGNLGPVSRD